MADEENQVRRSNATTKVAKKRTRKKKPAKEVVAEPKTIVAKEPPPPAPPEHVLVMVKPGDYLNRQLLGEDPVLSGDKVICADPERRDHMLSLGYPVGIEGWEPIFMTEADWEVEKERRRKEKELREAAQRGRTGAFDKASRRTTRVVE